MSSDQPLPGVSSTGSINARQAQLNRLRQMRQADRIEARQVLAERTSIENAEQAMFNPLYMMKNAENLEKRLRRNEHKQSSEAQEDDPEMADIDATAKAADEYEQRNPEMEKRALLGLKHNIFPDDSPEEMLRKILKSYPDQYLADEALDFLCSSSDANSKLGINLRIARHLLNERFGREVRAGRNMNEEAREFARQGLGSAGALRDLYRDITGNHREPVTLFEELNESFTFEKMKTVLKFLLHSIGSDLKSKGPSISRPELQGLFTEARTMQAILGVYRFFFQRMKLMMGLFKKEDLELPKRLNFELLAKQFIKMISERYPSPDKILRMAASLGISEELLAQIIVYSQFRDAMRGVSPRLFKSDRHRQDILMALIETLSELDDLVEDEEEEEDDEEEAQPGWSQTDTIQ